MAKVTGPLMSLDASGTVGGTAVFSKWKGRNYVRLRVIPQNIRSAGQQLTRGFLGALAKSAKAVFTAFKDTTNHLGSQFFADAVAAAPTGQSWVSYLQKQLHADVASLQTTYLALSGTIRGYYDAEADIMGVFPYVSVGGTPVTYTKGFLVYLLAVFAVNSLHYTGFASGPDGADAAELADFGDYVQVGLTP